MDPGVFHPDVVFEFQKKLLNGFQRDVGVQVDFVLADAIIFQVNHAAPQRGREIDPQERGVVEEGEVVVDLVTVAEHPDAGKALLPVQNLAAEAVDHDLYGIGDFRQGSGIPFGTEVNILEVPGDMKDPARGSYGEGDRAVGGPARLHQAKAQAQAALVQIALEPVQGSDPAERGRVFEHLNEPREFRGKLRLRAFLVHFRQDAPAQILIEGRQNRTLFGIGGKEGGEVADDPVRLFQNAFNFFLGQRGHIDECRPELPNG